MHPAAHPAPNTEEHAPGHNCRVVYLPLIWLARMVIRLGLRAAFLMPSRPQMQPRVIHRNRQLRRARESCLRRARRHALMGRTFKAENYTPRAYAHFAYVSRMDKSITPAQFREHYIRDNNVTRMQVYGMDSAHEITEFVPESRATLSSLFSNLISLLGVTSLSLAAPADPAPP